jgi:hypothetical protein
LLAQRSGLKKIIVTSKYARHVRGPHTDLDSGDASGRLASAGARFLTQCPCACRRRTLEEWEKDVLGFKQADALDWADALLAETKAFEMKEQKADDNVRARTRTHARPRAGLGACRALRGLHVRVSSAVSRMLMSALCAGRKARQRLAPRLQVS